MTFTRLRFNANGTLNIKRSIYKGQSSLSLIKLAKQLNGLPEFPDRIRHGFKQLEDEGVLILENTDGSQTAFECTRETGTSVAIYSDKADGSLSVVADLTRNFIQPTNTPDELVGDGTLQLLIKYAVKALFPEATEWFTFVHSNATETTTDFWENHIAKSYPDITFHTNPTGPYVDEPRKHWKHVVDHVELIAE